MAVGAMIGKDADEVKKKKKKKETAMPPKFYLCLIQYPSGSTRDRNHQYPRPQTIRGTWIPQG